MFSDKNHKGENKIKIIRGNKTRNLPARTMKANIQMIE